ncbi:hypothetical protein HZB00_01800 [Candidatus Woesearchaeota archaeon]|nr:hypothetical protein [Candidatus Woesearchaeota archaeon]
MAKNIPTLLQTKKVQKKRKPSFERQYANVMTQFKGQWRRPRGMHSKMRMSLRGKKTKPTVGFQSPVLVRGLESDGRMPLLVQNMKGLQTANVTTHALYLAHALGGRKRVALLQKAKELGITFRNIDDIDATLKALQENVANRKKEKTAAKKTSTKEEKKSESKSAEKSKPTVTEHTPGEKQ